MSPKSPKRVFLGFKSNAPPEKGTSRGHSEGRELKASVGINCRILGGSWDLVK